MTNELIPEEYDGSVQSGCEIESRLCVPLRGRPLSEIADNAPTLCLTFESICGADRLRHLGRQWRRYRHEVVLTTAVMDGHLSAFFEIITVSIALRHKLLQTETPPH